MWLRPFTERGTTVALSSPHQRKLRSTRWNCYSQRCLKKSPCARPNSARQSVNNAAQESTRWVFSKLTLNRTAAPPTDFEREHAMEFPVIPWAIFHDALEHQQPGTIEVWLRRGGLPTKARSWPTFLRHQTLTESIKVYRPWIPSENTRPLRVSGRSRCGAITRSR